MTVNLRLKPSNTRFDSFLVLRNFEASVGVSVKATKVETRTPVETTTPNDLKNLAAIPSIKKTTVNNATNTSVDETIGKKTSLAPVILALIRSSGVSSFKFLCAFSSTTMASSTTIPMSKSNASIVMVFSVRPNAYIMKIAPKSETGMVMLTMAMLE